jgi:hypothetical protein
LQCESRSIPFTWLKNVLSETYYLMDEDIVKIKNGEELLKRLRAEID